MACCWEGHRLGQSSTPPPQEQTLDPPSQDCQGGRSGGTWYPQWLQLLISHSQDDAVSEDDVHGAAVHLHERGCVHHLVAHLEQTEHTVASMRVWGRRKDLNTSTCGPTLWYYHVLVPVLPLVLSNSLHSKGMRISVHKRVISIQLHTQQHHKMILPDIAILALHGWSWSLERNTNNMHMNHLRLCREGRSHNGYVSYTRHTCCQSSLLLQPASAGAPSSEQWFWHWRQTVLWKPPWTGVCSCWPAATWQHPHVSCTHALSALAMMLQQSCGAESVEGEGDEWVQFCRSWPYNAWQYAIAHGTNYTATCNGWVYSLDVEWKTTILKTVLPHALQDKCPPTSHSK